MGDAINEFDVHVERVEGYRFTVRFDKDQYEPVVFDEPEPLGQDAAPNAARYLAAAVGNCLSASLLFCTSRHKLELEGIETEVHAEISRNEKGRMRISKLNVRIKPQGQLDAKGFERCVGIFEDYCTVTQSVRAGIDVDVVVEPKPTDYAGGIPTNPWPTKI